MDERGFALPEALVVTAIVGVVWAAASGVLTQLPAQAAKWEDAAAMRQRVRVIEARVGRLIAGAAPIEVDVDGRLRRVPSIWPRRLGSIRPGAQGEVSPAAVTFISRSHGERLLLLAGPLPGTGGEVTVLSQPGCGSQSACGLREGDAVIAIDAQGRCGLFRVETAGARLRLAALMQSAAPAFGPGSALVPVAIDGLWFDSEEAAIRRYDGYRSDNVMIDGVQSMALDWSNWGRALGDGPFIGAGPLAYDLDQIAVREVRASIVFAEAATTARRLTLGWGLGPWP